MSTERYPTWASPSLQPLVDLVRARWPSAALGYRQAPDGSRGYLEVSCAETDDFTVLEALAGATVDVYLRHGLIVHVLPFRTPPDAPAPAP